MRKLRPPDRVGVGIKNGVWMSLDAGCVGDAYPTGLWYRPNDQATSYRLRSHRCAIRVLQGLKRQLFNQRLRELAVVDPQSGAANHEGTATQASDNQLAYVSINLLT